MRQRWCKAKWSWNLKSWHSLVWRSQSGLSSLEYDWLLFANTWKIFPSNFYLNNTVKWCRILNYPTQVRLGCNHAYTPHSDIHRRFKHSFSELIPSNDEISPLDSGLQCQEEVGCISNISSEPRVSSHSDSELRYQLTINSLMIRKKCKLIWRLVEYKIEQSCSCKLVTVIQA